METKKEKLILRVAVGCRADQLTAIQQFSFTSPDSHLTANSESDFLTSTQSKTSKIVHNEKGRVTAHFSLNDLDLTVHYKLYSTLDDSKFCRQSHVFHLILDYTDNTFKLPIYDVSSRHVQVKLPTNYLQEMSLYSRAIDAFRQPSNLAATKIPKIIHQMWLSPSGAPPPAKYFRTMATWAVFNPEWTIKIWTNDQVQELITDYFPQYLTQFNSLTRIISKCDIARMCVLAVYGGLYTDLDFYCVRNVEGLVAGRSIVLCQEPADNVVFGRQKLFNGILACEAGHPFIRGWIDQMFYNVSNSDPWMISYVMQTTGPNGFFDYYGKTPSTTKPDLTPGAYVIPFSAALNRSCDCRQITTADNIVPCYAETIWGEGTKWGTNSTTWSVICIIILVIVVLILMYTSYRYLN